MPRESLVVLALLLLPLTYASAATDSFELVPGVVVHSGVRPAVYLMSPDASIDAVDPASGALLWSSREAARPLLVWGDLLVAQTEPASTRTLGIALLDLTNGRRRASFAVPLPAGVTGRVADTLGSHFDTWAEIRDGRLMVGWEHVQRRVSPIPPRPGEPLEKRLTGGALLGPIAWTVTPLAAPPERPPVPIGRQAWDDGITDAHLRAGGVLAATRMVGAPGQRRLVLKRWDAKSGTSLPDVALVDGDNLRLPSADGRFLLVSREETPSAGDGYVFRIFSLETGRLLGKMVSARSLAFFAVTGDALLYESPPFAIRDGATMVVTPRQLRVVDLARGTARWERPLRDTSYRDAIPQ